MIDTFSLLQKYTGISKYSQSEVITPQNIVKDMVDMLPQEVFNPDATFFDPAVKSGRFLIEIYNRLMASPLLAHIPELDRHRHIIEKQLFGFATSSTAAIVVRKALYNDPLATGNIRFTSGEVTKESVQGAFNNMRFDVIIGNPPYNNDIYIYFALLCKKLLKLSGYMSFITPAKWQAKGGDINDKFRKEIVPYMSKIVFYPNCKDVFNINDPGGLSYYLVESKQSAVATVINRCERQVYFNNEAARAVCGQRKTLNNLGQQIFEHIRASTWYRPFSIESMPKNGRYETWLNNKASVGSAWDQTLYDKSGAFHCISLCRVIDRADTANIMSVPDDSRLAAAFDSVSEGYSFQSWVYTKFVRFGVSNSLCGLTGIATNDTWWRFVPDPGSWDCIYEDAPLPGYTPDLTTGVYLDAEGKKHCSLYVKYNLTTDEIKVIESVIKSRK